MLPSANIRIKCRWDTAVVTCAADPSLTNITFWRRRIALKGTFQALFVSVRITNCIIKVQFLIFRCRISLIRREGSLRNLKIHAGTNFQNESGVVYSSAAVRIHPNYSSSQLINDIALIHVQSTIEYTTKVQPIKLTATDIDLGPCKLTGWGTTRVCNCKLLTH